MRSIALLPFVLLAACGGSSDDGVVVFAAASLTDAFEEIAEAYTAETGDEVVLSFAGSSDLAAQIGEGAPAEVFASADLANMAEVDTERSARTFATNRAEIAVEPGNPNAIATLDDLADPDLVVVVCAEQVPCGSYTSTILDRAGVALTPASFESNVRAVLTKVVLGEADAGIVYATDVVAADGSVDGVPIEDEFNVDATYPIVAFDDAGDEFVEFVLGDRAQDILGDHGFGSP